MLTLCGDTHCSDSSVRAGLRLLTLCGDTHCSDSSVRAGLRLPTVCGDHCQSDDFQFADVFCREQVLGHFFCVHVDGVGTVSLLMIIIIIILNINDNSTIINDNIIIDNNNNINDKNNVNDKNKINDNTIINEYSSASWLSHELCRAESLEAWGSNSCATYCPMIYTYCAEFMYPSVRIWMRIYKF